jgi:enoyl-[acyl-carrier protein] reductase II
MLAAMALGAEAVQVGSLFAATEESSAHINFKNEIIKASDGATELSLKQLTPVRLLKNDFYQAVKTAEANCATKEELTALLGRGRAKKGMFEGDLIEGELEIGQIAALISTIKPAAQVVAELLEEYRTAKAHLSNAQYDF